MELHVRVVDARRLLDVQTFGTQDPFCKLKLCGRKQETSVDDNGGAAQRLDRCRIGCRVLSSHAFSACTQAARPRGTRSSCSKWRTRSETTSSSRSRTRATRRGEKA